MCTLIFMEGTWRTVRKYFESSLLIALLLLIVYCSEVFLLPYPLYFSFWIARSSYQVKYIVTKGTMRNTILKKDYRTRESHPRDVSVEDLFQPNSTFMFITVLPF